LFTHRDSGWRRDSRRGWRNRKLGLDWGLLRSRRGQIVSPSVIKIDIHGCIVQGIFVGQVVILRERNWLQRERRNFQDFRILTAANKRVGAKKKIKK
jgi:hypothetical protein